MKYKITLKAIKVMNEIGMSTRVNANASVNGWYMADLECRWTIGR